jgi:hypothetical protein
MDISDDGSTSKRTDVGYKRPPVETRFKKGQKPPARKKKAAPEFSAHDLLWKVLHDTRRVNHNGEIRWLTNAELIVRAAMLEAEKGSSTLHRLLARFWLYAEDGAEIEEVIPIMILD